MNPLGALRKRLPIRAVFGIGTAVSIVAIVIIVRSVDGSALRHAFDEALADGRGMSIALGTFAAAFVVRTIAWLRVVPSLSFGQALAAIHVALGANHVLPFRLGEPLRVVSAVRRDGLGLEAAAASTVTLRAADMLSVVAIGAIVAPSAMFDLLGVAAWICLALITVAAVVGWRWLSAIARRRTDVKLPGVIALSASASAWLLESVLVWQTAHWAGLDPTWSDAVLVTAVAIAAQVAAFAPGGIGSYEAAAVAGWVALGYASGPALVAALSAHALKTAYSLVTGAIAVALPSPSLIGRLRLRKDIDPRLGETEPAADAPVVLFMPAYNEEEAVGACIDRAPSEVHGRPVQVLVIDDGSADATAQVARDAGAEVIELGQNQGLGAAVRRGFEIGVERQAAAVVFCDADGEYPPEELANIVEPILSGRADYVGGSRFLGDIEHMRPHRRFGNIVLTRVLSIVARRRITDGQTGYRGLSLAAARDAEIIHDFNYAQVLTLDLLAKGYRYEEVPISYHFRTTGESFIKLGRYLRNVVPAVYRELNAA
ncbi:MAG: lysylphosphatidylglycerol synthase domain-containing protein [Actinomycetota bacterium]